MKIIISFFLTISSLLVFSQNENNTDTCYIRLPQVINSSCPPAGGDKIRYNCIPDTFKLKLFNRWGNLVFETHDINISLDKIKIQSDSIKNIRLPQGTYFYIFNAKFQDGKELEGITGYIRELN